MIIALLQATGADDGAVPDDGRVLLQGPRAAMAGRHAHPHAGGQLRASQATIALVITSGMLLGTAGTAASFAPEWSIRRFMNLQ